MTEVVISGIGGSFPGSQTVQEFGQDLLDNKYLPTPTKRWKDGNKFGAPAVCGEVPYNNFDGYFFGVSRSLAACSDPVYKIGYQSCFQAIIDAGLSPFSMKGSNVAVYASSGVNEHEQRAVYAKHCMFHGNYLIVGNNRSMMANRMSFLFGFHGPSSAMDFSWAGVHMLLSIAANAIKSGEVNEALIVVSCISKDPELALALRGLGLMSKDGRTRSFDKDASGSVRSDCCVAMFLQRADRAKRCYAKVLASGLEAIGEIDKVLPDPRGIQNFLSNLYRSHSIDPKRIAYMEADGSAHPVRDECELAGVDAALVKGAGRSTPLLVGSVRSNLGYADVATGAAAICKAVVAMETGTIPATIDFREANPNIESLVEGRLRVVDANTPLGLAADSVLAVNSLGLLGSVGHTVLQPNPRAPEPPQDPSLHLPRLVPVAGRTEESVKEAIAKILAAPFDIHYYRLVQDVFSSHINGFTYRSYAICPPAENDVHKVTKLEKRTVWFVYSGMGSQWAGMGAGLMRIPLFAETIERLHAVLVPKGVDLKKILTETGPEAFDNILKSFVGIAACQIALTNVLTAIGVIPDGIVGHSVGEQACAYADGCLTEEQAILAAWARGAASNDATLIKGKMAAVGLGYKDMLPRLPPTIDVACHNSSTSCTLSGPAEDVEHFVKQLSEEGVFARAVDVAGIAYHSRYIQAAGPFLRQHLGSVLTNPKRRSSRWVTTSVPSEKRDEDWTKFCSVEYLTNNLLSPVLFEEALQHIPEQAVVIEIAPHGLLQAILKRALPEPIHIPLTNRGQADADRYLLDAIGKISCTAPVPNVTALYPDTKFPVPRGTPSLANLVLWQADNVDTHDPYEALNEKVRSSPTEQGMLLRCTK
ncbi:hypothetical protein ONE63_001695 [Megalurothrips usitatus]|uniref:Ketosynthase family 3 (KS3) domain-containing protein n=1 Tax=Megalurothrips usitatus TaxID=439358 RepID=A0AAV7XCT8_9NEOP|nr:hypothetical protein ONE63_001695 [Megalurothrips usitatus]